MILVDQCCLLLYYGWVDRFDIRNQFLLSLRCKKESTKFRFETRSIIRSLHVFFDAVLHSKTPATYLHLTGHL